MKVVCGENSADQEIREWGVTAKWRLDRVYGRGVIVGRTEGGVLQCGDGV